MSKRVKFLLLVMVCSVIFSGCDSTTNITYEINTANDEKTYTVAPTTVAPTTEKQSTKYSASTSSESSRKESGKTPEKKASGNGESDKADNGSQDDDYIISDEYDDYGENNSNEGKDNYKGDKDDTQIDEEGENVAYAEDGQGYAYVIDSDNAGLVELKDIHVIDEFNYFYGENGFVDSYGNEHYGYHCLHNSIDESYVIFNLNGEYKRFTGSIVLKDEDGSSSKYNTSIFVDNTKIFSKNGITKTTGEISFDVDVEFCSQLKIVTTGYPITGAGIRIVNAMLE